jgi:hypothetical protein
MPLDSMACHLTAAGPRDDVSGMRFDFLSLPVAHNGPESARLTTGASMRPITWTIHHAKRSGTLLAIDSAYEDKPGQILS